MSYQSNQPVHEWLTILVVVVTIIAFAGWKAWGWLRGFIDGLKKAIDSVWRERR